MNSNEKPTFNFLEFHDVFSQQMERVCIYVNTFDQDEGKLFGKKMEEAKRSLNSIDLILSGEKNTGKRESRLSFAAFMAFDPEENIDLYSIKTATEALDLIESQLSKLKPFFENMQDRLPNLESTDQNVAKSCLSDFKSSMKYIVNKLYEIDALEQSKAMVDDPYFIENLHTEE